MRSDQLSYASVPFGNGVIIAQRKIKVKAYFAIWRCFFDLLQQNCNGQKVVETYADTWEYNLKFLRENC